MVLKQSQSSGQVFYSFPAIWSYRIGKNCCIKAGFSFGHFEKHSKLRKNSRFLQIYNVPIELFQNCSQNWVVDAYRTHDYSEGLKRHCCFGQHNGFMLVLRTFFTKTHKITQSSNKKTQGFGKVKNWVCRKEVQRKSLY